MPAPSVSFDLAQLRLEHGDKALAGSIHAGRNCS